jgi:hypothetical protein
VEIPLFYGLLYGSIGVYLASNGMMRGEEETSPTSCQRGCYIKTITASVQLENKITGRESQWACRQVELIGGKPPVVK